VFVDRGIVALGLRAAFGPLSQADPDFRHVKQGCFVGRVLNLLCDAHAVGGISSVLLRPRHIALPQSALTRATHALIPRHETIETPNGSGFNKMYPRNRVAWPRLGSLRTYSAVGEGIQESCHAEC